MESLTVVNLIVWIAVAVTWVCADASTNGKVVIEGPRDFVTDGTRWLTLNATATNMGMSPDYAWSGLCSSNTDTCTIRPRLDQDGGTVYCVATNPDTEQSVSAQYDLHLKYPPAEAPVISKRTARAARSPGGKLTSGEELTCKVSGGEPLVASVNFTCTNPFLPDQKDVNDTISVFSSVTVDARGATEGPMVCTCSAEWSQEPALYQQEQTMTFTVEMPSPPDERTSAASEITSSSDEMVSASTDRTTLPTDSKDNTLAIGVGVGVPLFVILAAAAVIVFVCRRKKWNRAQTDIEADSAPTKPVTPDKKVPQGNSFHPEKKSILAEIVATVVNCFVDWRKKWNRATGTPADTEVKPATRKPDTPDKTQTQGNSSCLETSVSKPFGCPIKMSEDNENTEDKQPPAVHQSLSAGKLEHEQTVSASKDLGTGKATQDDQSTSSGDNTDSDYASGRDNSSNSNSSTGSDVSSCSTSSSGPDDSTTLSHKTDQSHSEENEAVQ